MAEEQAKRKSIEPTTADQKPTIVPLTSPPENNNGEAPVSIPKPGKSSLNMFKSTRDPTIAGVEKVLTPLPHHKISDAKDFVRLHHDEEKYWSTELCFVNVPIKGQKRDQLHLINEELAERYLPSDRIKRFRLALATKPYDVFFLCHVPSQNLDNTWCCGIWCRRTKLRYSPN